jgi:hypothetical protein
LFKISRERLGLTGNRNLNADAKKESQKSTQDNLPATCCMLLAGRLRAASAQMQMRVHWKRAEYQRRYRHSIEKSSVNPGFFAIPG